MTDEKSEQVANALTLLDIGLKALGTKLVLVLALCFSFALFIWAMLLQTWIGFAIAGAFGIGIFIPILWSARLQQYE